MADDSGSDVSDLEEPAAPKAFILRKDPRRDEAAARAKAEATAKAMIAADKEAKVFERELKLGRKLEEHEKGGQVARLSNDELRQYLGLSGPTANVPRRRSISKDQGGQITTDLDNVRRGIAPADGGSHVEAPSAVLSAAATFLELRKQKRDDEERQKHAEEKTLTPAMVEMAKKWREKARGAAAEPPLVASATAAGAGAGGASRRASVGSLGDKPPLTLASLALGAKAARRLSLGGGRRSSVRDLSGGMGRRYSRMSRGSLGDISGDVKKLGDAAGAPRLLEPRDFADAEERDAEFLETPTPLPAAVPGWGFRVGPKGLGYYKTTAEKVAPKAVPKQADKFERKMGWGRLAIAALENNNVKQLRSAAATTSTGLEELKVNLNMRVKGGSSWYYGDKYVRMGLDPEPFPPRPGDTLLHMALRHKRSTAFVATLLQLGSDRKIRNRCGEAAEEVHPLDFASAEDLMERWRQEKAIHVVGESRDASRASTPTGTSRGLAPD
ncbi:hypothetical protein SO694_000382124 [Aureococcus anophagefferens]|uniref:Uncharacterized protein n=1 Tax=Aureococcus anophagefferens TaxID=44056 RepID=A0ABR1FLY1_AURAN